MLAAMAPALITELADEPRAFAIRLGVAVAFAAVAYGLWRGEVYRAADAKGLMVLGLALSPIGYYAALEGRFLVAFDALPVALIAGEGWRRLGGPKRVPFFVVLFPVLLVTLIGGGVLWWPVVWLVGLVA